MAARPAGEWQSYDITLIGRRVSVVANGKKIITDQIIPGITGGALDSKEGLPGSSNAARGPRSCGIQKHQYTVAGVVITV
jgi:hypothetical protein